MRPPYESSGQAGTIHSVLFGVVGAGARVVFDAESAWSSGDRNQWNRGERGHSLPQPPGRYSIQSFILLFAIYKNLLIHALMSVQTLAVNYEECARTVFRISELACPTT